MTPRLSFPIIGLRGKEKKRKKKIPRNDGLPSTGEQSHLSFSRTGRVSGDWGRINCCWRLRSASFSPTPSCPISKEDAGSKASHPFFYTCKLQAKWSGLSAFSKGASPLLKVGQRHQVDTKNTYTLRGKKKVGHEFQRCWKLKHKWV